jgi:DNA-binding Lrp family transcriptional regulator
VSEQPYADAAAGLGLTEDELLARLQGLIDSGTLSRFGPLYDAERLGGAVTLAAMAVPEAVFDEVAGKVNAHSEVAHNYARAHAFNMWFVVATETPARVAEVLRDIEAETGLAVYDMPKLREFYIGLRLAV